MAISEDAMGILLESLLEGAQNFTALSQLKSEA